MIRHKGGLLLEALILIAIMMLVLNSLFDSTILQVKMTDYFKWHRQEKIDSEIALERRIRALEKNGECKFPFCELIQFVPDAYWQYENQGVHYYRLHGPLLATVAIRKRSGDSPWSHPISLKMLSEYDFDPITIGHDPQNRGVLFYINKGLSIEAWQMLPNAAPKWLYTITENTRLSLPTLWHGRLIIDRPEDNKISLYDAYSGKKIREAALSPSEPINDVPLCTLSPTVMVRESREHQREIIVTRDNTFWLAKMDVDSDRLGKRTVKEGE